MKISNSRKTPKGIMESCKFGDLKIKQEVNGVEYSLIIPKNLIFADGTLKAEGRKIYNDWRQKIDMISNPYIANYYMQEESQKIS